MNDTAIGGTSSGANDPEFSGGILKKPPQKIKVRAVKTKIAGPKVDGKRNNKVVSEILSKKTKLESASTLERRLDSHTTLNSAPDIRREKEQQREGIIKLHQPTQVDIRRGHASSKQPPSQVLLNEILCLGGTQEDFDLVKDMESEDEVMGAEAIGKNGKNLRAGLERIMTQMGYGVGKFTTQQVIADDMLSEDEVEEFENGKVSEHGAGHGGRDSTRKSIQGIDTRPLIEEIPPASMGYSKGGLVCSSLFYI